MQIGELDNRIQFNAGKVILIKFNLTGISQFFMNQFIIPTYICKEIGRTNRNIFWNNNKGIDTQGTEQTIQMIAWDKTYRSKCEGEHRIKKNRGFCVAFLAEQG